MPFLKGCLSAFTYTQSLQSNLNCNFTSAIGSIYTQVSLLFITQPAIRRDESEYGKCKRGSSMATTGLIEYSQYFPLQDASIAPPQGSDPEDYYVKQNRIGKGSFG